MRKSFIKIIKILSLIIARLTLKKFNPFVIAITGSVGKTSAKEAIYSVLSKKKRVRKSLSNFNNELGVPLTILGDWSCVSKPAWLFWLKVFFLSFLKLIFGIKRFYPEILILEYGADRPGDISYLLKIAKPNLAIISAIGTTPVHVEFYLSGVEGVAKEKGKLISDLSSFSTAVLNYDDPLIYKMKGKTRAKIISYGFSNKADIKISNFGHILRGKKIEGINFKLESGGISVPISIGSAFSISHAYAVACSACVAKVFGINFVEFSEIISYNYSPFSGRSVIIDGIKNSQIIDESYNSSPLALETSLITMEKISFKRKIAVLGDMLELGKFSIKSHEAIGALIPSCVDILITVGARAKLMADSAVRNGMNMDYVYYFDNSKEAGLKLQEIIKQGDLVLVKGSRAIGLDRVIDEVMEMKLV